jgi:hypothetical protein
LPNKLPFEDLIAIQKRLIEQAKTLEVPRTPQANDAMRARLAKLMVSEKDITAAVNWARSRDSSSFYQ